MKIEQFIKEQEIACSAVSVPENPTFLDPGENMKHWHVTLTNKKGEVFTLYYSMGLGHVEMQGILTRPDPHDNRRKYRPWVRISPADYLHPKWYTLKHQSSREGLISGVTCRTGRKVIAGSSSAGNSLFQKFRWTVPTALDVLENLHMDAGYDFCDFEDWASNLGYDTDSRSAEKTFNVCREYTKKLRKFFGSAWETFINCEEE